MGSISTIIGKDPVCGFRFRVENYEDIYGHLQPWNCGVIQPCWKYFLAHYLRFNPRWSVLPVAAWFHLLVQLIREKICITKRHMINF